MVINNFHSISGDSKWVLGTLVLNLQTELIIYDGSPEGYIDRNKETLYVPVKMDKGIIEKIRTDYWNRTYSENVPEHEYGGVQLKVEFLTQEQQNSLFLMWGWITQTLDKWMRIICQGASISTVQSVVKLSENGVTFGETSRLHPVTVRDYAFDFDSKTFVPDPVQEDDDIMMDENGKWYQERRS